MPGECHLCGKSNSTKLCGACKLVFYCTAECQRKSWKTHKVECKRTSSQTKKATNGLTATARARVSSAMRLSTTPFTFTLPAYNKKLIRIEQINEHKGYGMIANTDIKKGTVLCREKPIMTIAETSHYTAPVLNVIVSQFCLLSADKQNVYRSLANRKKNKNKNNDNENENGNETETENENESQELLNIWITNQIRMPERDECGIFPLIARINHSCFENAHWRWIPQFNEERVVALRDIPRNTEITVNYTGDPIVFRERQLKLQKTWGIDCKCEWCSQSIAEADNDSNNNNNNNDNNNDACVVVDDIEGAIAIYQSLEKTLPSLGMNPMLGYANARKLIKIVKESFGECPQLTHKHCYDAAQFALGLAKWNDASYYLETSMKMRRVAQGNDIAMDDAFREKVSILPANLRVRFKKFETHKNGKSNKKSKKSKRNKNGRHR